MNLLTATTLTNTGEAIKNYGLYIGLGIIVAIIFFLVWRKKKDNNDKN